MSTRELRHPAVSWRREGEDFAVKFMVPGSRFGPVEVVLSQDEVIRLGAWLRALPGFIEVPAILSGAGPNPLPGEERRDA
jgi:hypothetical protein